MGRRDLKFDRSGLRAPLYMAAGATVFVLTGRVLFAITDTRLLINVTPSVPVGLYLARTSSGHDCRRGEIVAFLPRDGIANLIRERNWLPEGVPIVKKVGAVAGDQYCVNAGQMTVNGRPVGAVSVVDSAGRPLPQIRGCHRVNSGEFLPVGDIDRSFDGRYMGAQPISSIAAVLTPLWLHGGDGQR